MSESTHSMQISRLLLQRQNLVCSDTATVPLAKLQISILEHVERQAPNALVTRESTLGVRLPGGNAIGWQEGKR